MGRRALPIISGALLVFFVYESAVRILLAPFISLPDLAGGIAGQTIILVLFSVLHSTYALGFRHTLVFFISTAVISWAFEQVGVATGFIYGAYHYTDVLGVKLGHVPLLIPLAWYMMIYPSWCLALSITRQAPAPVAGTQRAERGRPGLLGISFLAAMIMTAWDLVADPLLSGPSIKAWIWEKGGPYFGIPLRNYGGWMITTFVVYLVYRLFERSARPRSGSPQGPLMSALPFVAYASVMISNSVANERKEMVVIGLLAMGLPLCAAILGFRRAHG
jgi:putative membrane protein